ncbi:MAG: ABC transporter substrate-binding protein [Oscillospiraceae bacterium]|nr:ABC transporter substrate-binding protein [Oscillospiraceae bacterium]
MKTTKKLAAILLLLCLALSMSACGGAQTPANSTAPTPTPTFAPLPSNPAEVEETEAPASASSLDFNLAELDFQTPVNIMVLNGPTGFGMAKLMANTNEKYALLDYRFTVESDASNVSAALINGDADIAALPTNAASVLYNRTGGVVVAAEIVRGNLYLLQSGGEKVSSFEDLRGKTVYAPAQNPSFIMSLLCEANGLTVGEDVEIDNTYAQPADLRTALAAGEVELAVLPEPMVTIAMSAGTGVEIALDLNEAWNRTSGDDIVLGCIVARKEWADEHPNELAAFLYEYNESVEFAAQAPEAAGALIEETGVFTNGAVAAKALPRCGLCYVTGEKMRGEIGAYLEKLYGVAPQAVGNELPGEDFYYDAKAVKAAE